jgi:DNA-3-methyladenine glycosylase II
MSRLRYNRRTAVDHLRRSCPRMQRFIGDCGPLKLRVAQDAGLFDALSTAIIYQQLSGKAAATINRRFRALFSGGVPDPSQAHRLAFDALRGAGLSKNKALSILDLAEHVVSGALPGPRKMAGMDDEEVTRSLCTVRGIGPWTAQMHLIFVLGRPDVMPATDLGIQKGVQYVYALDGLPDPAAVLEATGHLAPYRSAASWYFWLAADTGLIT